MIFALGAAVENALLGDEFQEIGSMADFYNYVGDIFIPTMYSSETGFSDDDSVSVSPRCSSCGTCAQAMYSHCPESWASRQRPELEAKGALHDDVDTTHSHEPQ